MSPNLTQGKQPTTVSLMDGVVRKIEQFATGGQYAPATPNPWRKPEASTPVVKTAPGSAARRP